MKDIIVTQLIKAAKSVGIDRAILYTILGKGFQILAGPITLVLIAHYLSPVEQGFYYTFSSVVGLQIFFELGLSFVILQFASHEKAGLTWTSVGLLEGNVSNKQRLISLLKLCLKWYGIIALLMLLILSPAGIWFLSSNSSSSMANWQLPWILVVISASGMLFLSPLLSFLEGCGLVAEVAYMRITQGLFSNFFLWVSLILQANLFAAAAPNLVGIVLISIWLYRKYRILFIDLLKQQKVLGIMEDQVKGISWRWEIFPLQWKIALSWLSGYFIFSLFTPVLFMFHGPVVAGRMGMSLSVTGAISAVAMSWISTKSSPFGSLIADKRYQDLNALFFPALLQSTGVSVLGSVSLWATVFFLQQIHHPLSTRVVDLLPLSLLIAASICNVYVYGLSVYLRAHKREPFLSISLLSGILIGTSTYFLGRDYGILGMSLGYLMVNFFVAVIPGTWIFFNKQKEWHY